MTSRDRLHRTIALAIAVGVAIITLGMLIGEMTHP